MFDGQLVRPPQRFREAARDYVCVRIVNIDDMDVNLFPFDYDLTLSIVLANADGTVYHRYGGRSDRSPMDMNTLVELMGKGLETHRLHEVRRSPAFEAPPLTVRELINDRLKGRMHPVFGCFHCHYVREANQYLALESGAWTPDQFWIWPLPARIGLTMDQKRQYEVAQVLPGSPADVAGVRSGDDVKSLKGRRILTQYDIQWILHQSADEAISLPFVLMRDGRRHEGTFELPAAWKAGDPADYAWRVRNVFTQHMIKFLPAPGFIGPRLSDPELTALDLAPGRFALKVEHLNYGAHLAGVRRGDIVLGAGGKSDFASQTEFFRHCELMRRNRRSLRMEILRDGAPMNVMVTREHLNDSPVETAPRVSLGFIPQELPGDGGLRVGNVTGDSSADKAGLRLGDRIVSVDGQDPHTHAALRRLLDRKHPGDLLTLDVTRERRRLQFGFALPDEGARTSEVAHLSATPDSLGQQLTCTISLKLPPDHHVYSLHKQGFGVPTQLEFRGRGFKLLGPPREPAPRRIVQAGLEPMWVIQGNVEFHQEIEVTDPGRFLLVLRVYAQVCDDNSCHEFRAIIANDGTAGEFVEFRGDFGRLPSR